jgi:S-DNA-T family DNA segregation ATPase FtsK/SpoIIIE
MGSSQKSTRRRGVEWRATLWLARHPGVAVVPAAAGAGVVEVGPVGVGGLVAGAAVGMFGWYRGHPDSFDSVAAPRVRAWRRRWLLSRYTGPRWHDVTLSCDLAPVDRKTGAPRFPRVLKVRSYSPTIDTLWIRLVPGQSPAQWEARSPELAEALKAERVAVERVRPQVLALVVERADPFGEVVDAPEMPWDSAAVDLSAVYLGEDERGADWCEPLLGQHWFFAGASGSGKNSLTWSPLRSIAPLIRDGLVRPWFVDPKRMELARAAGVAYRYAAEPDDCLELVEEFTEDLRDVQRRLAADGKAKFVVSRETPLNLLVLDELAALLAFGEHARPLRRLLAEVGTQGRATGHSMLGYVQEPSKDTVPIRDLFTVRACLRVTSAAHVDMVLGDGARLRGAMADEIPNDPSTAGVGFVVRQRSRVPTRVRAAYVDDAEVAQLVQFVTGPGSVGLRAVV